MNKLSLFLYLTLSLLFSAEVRSNAKESLQHITPEEAGYSAEKLKELQCFLEKSGSGGLLLLYDGKVFFEWGDSHQKILVHSMRKALLNSLYGIYEQSGAINLKRTLAEMKIDDIAPSLSEQEKTSTLSDILKSRSGVYHSAAAESEGMNLARPLRDSNKPGQFYYYNNWDFNVAGAIFEKYSNKRIYDAFYEEIAKPIGMMDYRNHIVELSSNYQEVIDANADGFYQYEPELSKYPAYHFRMSAYDLALYGQLYLNRGQWNGEQIIPANWIDRSTVPYSMVEQDYGLAYGMLWDVLVPENQNEKPSFYHTGVGVHMLGVYPKHKLVMVHRVNTEQEYTFNDGDLYTVIKMIHGARLSKE